MTHSMTAFARTENEHGPCRFSWEVRSVNHRYLDVHLKLPDDFKSLETACRDIISANLNRGRVDAYLQFEKQSGQASSIEINEDALNAFLAVHSQLKQKCSDLDKVRLSEILKWPGMVVTETADLDTLSERLLNDLRSAMSSLLENRSREGSTLQLAISTRIQEAREITLGLKAALPELREVIQNRLLTRISELTEEVDSSRINQEVAILLNKSDIDEEIDRLETHFDEVDRVLSNNKPKGRRLDFLMQELNREANTIGSKSTDMGVSNASVNLKVLIDQMREQVQNIE